MLHGMMTAYQKNDTAAEVWILPLADDSGFHGGGNRQYQGCHTGGRNGVISLYIAGDAYS
jgi:phage tail sheath gpL-like